MVSGHHRHVFKPEADNNDALPMWRLVLLRQSCIPSLVPNCILFCHTKALPTLLQLSQLHFKLIPVFVLVEYQGVNRKVLYMGETTKNVILCPTI